MTELFINEVRVDLYSQDNFGITYQTSNLIDLNSRGGFYTNKFKIPLTSTNKAILGHANIVNSDTNYTYEFNTASIRIDGVEVLSDGVATIESTTETEAVVNILSGNSDFFNLIKGLNFSDIDLSVYNHTLNAATFETYVTGVTSGLVYPFMGYSDINVNPKIDVGSFIGAVNRKINIGELVPSIFVNDLFNHIEKHTGWTLDGDLRSNPEFLKLAFSANKFQKEYDDKDNTAERITSASTFYNAGSKPLGAIFGNYARTTFNMPYNSYDSTMTQSADLILCDKSANYEFDVNLNLTLTYPNGRHSRYAIRYCRVDSGGNFIEETPFRSQDLLYFFDNGYDYTRTTNGTDTTEIKSSFKITHYMEAGNYYKPFLYYLEDTRGSSGSYTTTVKMNVGSSISFKETSTLYPLDDVNGNLLFDWDVSTFLKDIILMFGINLQPNNITKTLTFNYLKDLPSNEVEDWSSKVDLNKGISLSYKYGDYAQLNKFQYSESDESIDGSFTINDLTLPSEKTVVKTTVDGLHLDFNYTTVVGGSYTNCIAPIFDVTDRVNNPSTITTGLHVDRYEKLIDKKCYFTRISGITPLSNSHGASFVGKHDPTTTLGATLVFPNFYNGSLPFARFKIGTSSGLEFNQLIPTYYQPIIDMFDKLKVVSLYLNLSPTDIQSLDFSKPKRIVNDRMNDTFFLLQIQNFKANQSTKCLLIRL